MSGTDPPRRVKAPGAYLALPLWGRFALALLVATVLVVAMVIYVGHNNTDAQTSTNVAAAVQANRDAEILIAQDQAPRTSRLVPGASARAELERAVHRRMAALAASGAVTGPIGATRCHTVGGTAPRRAFACAVVSGGVAYPFQAVIDTTARRITFCKRDPPPVASDDVPVSPRCRV